MSPRKELMQEQIQILIGMSARNNVLVSSLGLSMSAIVSNEAPEDGVNPTSAIGVDSADVRLLELGGYIKVQHRGDKLIRYALTPKGQAYISPELRGRHRGNSNYKYHGEPPFVQMIRGGKHAKWFSPELAVAGLQLHHDFELMIRPKGNPRTFNWEMLGVPSSQTVNNYIPKTWFSNGAANRFEKAMRTAGPILADILLSVICHERGLEDTERILDIPARSGKILLVAALWQLHHFYKGEPDLAVIR